MRTLKITLFVSALFTFMLLGLSGCGEDPPQTPPGATKKAVKEKAADNKKAAAEKKAEAGDDEKTKGKGAGEAGKDEAGKVEVAPKTAEEVAAKARAEKVEADARKAQIDRTLKKVTAFGVTGPINKTRDAVIELLPAEAREQVRKAFDDGLAELAREGGLSTMDWLDQTRGIGFGFEGKDRPLLAVPVKSKEDFIKALPDTLKPDGNAGYTIGDSYVLPYENVLFVSDSFRTIDLIEGDLKLELTRLTTDKVLLVKLGGASLKTLVSSALDEVERGMSESMPMQQEQKEFLAKLFNFIKEILGEIDSITITADITNGELVTRYELVAVEGSRLATSFASVTPGNFAAAGLLPTKSFMFWAQNYPAEAAAPYMNRYVDLVATAWKLQDEERAEFEKDYTKLVSRFGPDAAYSMYSDSSFPLSMTSITQADNGLAARDEIYRFYSLVLNKAVESLPAEQKAIFASGSLKAVVDSFAPVFLNLGVGIKMETEEYRGGKVDYIMLTFDWAKLNLPPQFAWVTQVIKSRLGGALGFTQDHVVMTFGPNPVVRVKEVMDKAPGLKLAEVVGPGATQGKYIGLFAISVDRLVGALMEIGAVSGFLATQPWVPQLRKMKDIVVIVGLLEGGMWFEAKIGIGSIIEAFKDELLKELEKEKTVVAPAAKDAAVGE
jgi:hypothetical protein